MMQLDIAYNNKNLKHFIKKDTVTSYGAKWPVTIFKLELYNLGSEYERVASDCFPIQHSQYCNMIFL